MVVENTMFITVVYKSMLKNNTKALNQKGVIKNATKNEEKLFLIPVKK